MATLMSEHLSTKARTTDETRKPRKSHLRWVALGDCEVSLHAQGQYRQAHAEAIAASFDLEALGFPVCSYRDGRYYLIDGQHRVKATMIYGFAPTDKLQMEVYENLTEADEAELFLERNTIKTKTPWDKYHVAITAGRKEESEIDRIVLALGLRVTPRRENNGGIAAIASLQKLYRIAGPSGLAKTLRIIREAYGDAGFDANIVHGIGLCVHRYGQALNEEVLIERLQKASGGLNGLVLPAQKLRQTTGQGIAACIAASAVTLYNRGSGAKKLAPWWKQ